MNQNIQKKIKSNDNILINVLLDTNKL